MVSEAFGHSKGGDERRFHRRFRKGGPLGGCRLLDLLSLMQLDQVEGALYVEK